MLDIVPLVFNLYKGTEVSGPVNPVGLVPVGFVDFVPAEVTL